MRYAVIARSPLALALVGVVLLGVVILSVMTIAGAVLGAMFGAFRRRAPAQPPAMRVKAELDPSLEVFPSGVSREDGQRAQLTRR